MAREYAPDEPAAKKREFAEEAPPAQDRSRPITDVANRALVAGTLGAPVDIAAMAMRPFGYKEEAPVGGSEYIGKLMERAGMVTPTRRPIAELATGLAPALLTGGAALGRYGYGKASELAGALRGVKPEPLKAKTAEEIAGLTAQQEQKLAQTKRIQEQLTQQPAVAAERVQARATTPEAASEIQRGVREKLGADVAKARTAEQSAARAASSAQQEFQQAEAAVTALEQKLAGQPGMTADEFGRQLQQTTAKLSKDATTARKQAAGYEQVFQAAGDKPTVDTSGLIASIDKQYKQTRNPTLQNILAELKSQATTGAKVSETGVFEGGEKALSLRSADSLKGYMDSIISSKMHKSSPVKLDKEILNSLQNLKNQLMMQSNKNTDYKKAVSTFREMSRPLDIVERNGALRKVIDQDPVSTAYRMTEAEVTGQVIRKANAGNPTFTRLLQTNPDLQDSARLYFSKDLFGKDAAPTARSFENWLSTNERSLRQTGLYDQFSTLRNAQRSAQEAVDVAKGNVTAATERLATAAETTKKAERLAEKGTARLEAALKTAETPEQLAARVSKAEKRVAPAVSRFASEEQKLQRSLDALSELNSNLTRATKPEQVKVEVKATAEKLKDLGLINEQQRDQMLREVAQLGESMEARAEALKRVRNIVIGASALAGVSYGGRRIAYGIE
jgi:hypothetical protein